MKICGRCDQPIQDGERYETRDIPSPTAAGATVVLHVPLCEKKPFQATPAESVRR